MPLPMRKGAPVSPASALRNDQLAGQISHEFKPTRRRKQPERAIQIALVEHLSWRAPPAVWWAHYPAGGRRSRVTGRILKSMGTRAGVPDLILIASGRIFGLELKAARGRLSPEQIATHAAMRAAGATIGVASDVDAALDLLGSWGVLPEGRP